jgi:hypothetical protein
MKPTLDIAELRKALAQNHAGDDGATVAEMVEALGQEPTRSRCASVREKLRPLIRDGRVVIGRSVRTQINGVSRLETVYRFAGGGHDSLADSRKRRRNMGR